MKKFIEVHDTKDNKLLVNTDQIINLAEHRYCPEYTRVLLTVINCIPLEVKDSYDEIKRMIEEAQE